MLGNHYYARKNSVGMMSLVTYYLGEKCEYWAILSPPKWSAWQPWTLREGLVDSARINTVS